MKKTIISLVFILFLSFTIQAQENTMDGIGKLRLGMSIEKIVTEDNKKKKKSKRNEFVKLEYKMDSQVPNDDRVKGFLIKDYFYPVNGYYMRDVTLLFLDDKLYSIYTTFTDIAFLLDRKYGATTVEEKKYKTFNITPHNGEITDDITGYTVTKEDKLEKLIFNTGDDDIKAEYVSRHYVSDSGHTGYYTYLSLYRISIKNNVLDRVRLNNKKEIEEASQTFQKILDEL